MTDDLALSNSLTELATRHAPRSRRWLTGKWSPLCCIAQWQSDLCKPDAPGVYRLVALDPNNVEAQLERACGTDATGTLYIGRSKKSVRGRVGSRAGLGNLNRAISGVSA